MLPYPKITCPRDFKECISFGQVVSNDTEPMKGSFFCCGKHDGSISPVEQDKYTKCFHGEFRDSITFHDKRDLIDEMNVISSALSHIELDEMAIIESVEVK